MSTYEVIGGVSESLKRLLEHAIEVPGSVPAPAVPFPVWIGIPPKDDELDDKPLLNLFLYRITESPFLKNQEIPRPTPQGSYGHPPLSLSLHYLLTPYGRLAGNGVAGTSPDEVPAHYVLGSAMRVLHDNAVLVDGSTAGGADVLYPSVKDAYEKVKLRLEPISLEDVSKVWTALGRPYRLSAAYEVSVVQIESRKPRRHPQLVGKPPPAGPRIRTVAERNPLITDVQGARLPGPYAAIDDTLVVSGEDLAGDSPRVFFGDVEATVTSARNDRLTVLVPDDPRLQPGPQRLNVIRQVGFGTPPVLRVGARSRAAVWMLVPRVKEVAYFAGAGGVTPYVRIRGNRLYKDTLSCIAYIDDTLVKSADWTQRDPTEIRVLFPAPPSSGSTHRVRVLVNDVEALDAPAVEVP